MTASAELRERIRSAAAERRPLRIRGGGTKDFYGEPVTGEILDTRACDGIVAYEPTELYVTARCGTRVSDLERTLGDAGQMLPFEPPVYGDAATIGGAIAAGLAGPRRVSAGPARDYVLGIGLLDGRGEQLRFGGRVIKNVAGYDVSRALCGSLGTLGVITEVTLKVLPRPAAELSLRFELSLGDALRQLDAWAGRPLPLSASAWHDNVLTVRLSGSVAGVAAARAKLGGDPVAEIAAGEFWQALRHQTHEFFADGLWRLAVPPATPPLALPGAWLLEWHGTLRWLRSSADASAIRAAAADAGGHATLFRPGATRAPVFQPLPPPVLALHQRLKRIFDPERILNPGRMYPEL